MGFTLVQYLVSQLANSGLPPQEVHRGTRDMKRAYLQIPCNAAHQCYQRPSLQPGTSAIVRGGPSLVGHPGGELLRRHQAHVAAACGGGLLEVIQLPRRLDGLAL
eukprot:14422962-Heterocapsa_arctica.AAC.1